MMIQVSSIRFDALREQARVLLVLAGRNRWVHFGAIALVLCVALAAGMHGAIWPMIGACVVTEVLKVMMGRDLSHRLRHLQRWHVGFVVGISIVSTSVFMSFGVLFAAQGSMALMVFGLIWVFGLFLYVSTTYMQFPLFGLLQIIPASVAALAVVLMIRQTEYGTSTAEEWWLAILGLLAYCGTVMRVAAQTQDSIRTLRYAQRMASSRLRELEHMNARDPLTGLLNRRAFEARLQKQIGDGKGDDVTLFLVDLDGFKPVNDSYSHEAGDWLLVEISKRLSQLEGCAYCGRLGGDEFVLAVSHAKTEDQILAMGASIARCCAAPVIWQGKHLEIGASVGAARAKPGMTAAELCSNADRAMYTAKSDPERQVALYRPGEVIARTSLQDRPEILQALRSGEFQPFYQPKVDMLTGRTVGFEALARRVLPNGTIMSPGTFLPVLSEFGLLNEFTIRLTRQVVADLKHWRSKGLSPGLVSINIPEATLATISGRRELIAALRSGAGLQDSLVVEITEDVFIARSGGMVRDAVRMIRDLGVSVSLDDFGTGYASFQHLRDLQFDELKIDTSFVRDLGHDFSAEILVNGVLEIARGLGVRVIAEGVETEEQRERLIKMDCRSAQGFFWSQAIPANDVPGWLRDQPDTAGAPVERTRSA